MEDISKPFDVMIQKERVKQLSSVVSVGGDSIYILVKIKFIVKFSKTSYHSLCTAGSFNVPTASFDPCFNFDVPNHGVGSFPHEKNQKKLAENKKKCIDKKQIQGGSGGGKTWSNCINKKFRTNQS